MTTLVPLLAATGLVILFLGLPPVRTGRMSARVEPYLTGLKGKPSGLVATPGRSRWLPAERWLERRLSRLRLSTDRHLAERLAAAGERIGTAAYRLDQIVWAITATVASWALMAAALAAGLALDARSLPVLTVIALVAGFLARDWWLGRQISARRARLQEELPTALDLLTLSLMAGESVPAALARVGAILESGIGSELGAVVAEIRAGSSTVEALEQLKRRVPGPAVGRFVDALLTGIERGSPLADVLRAQADDGREARKRFLIEMGGRREVVMLVPVVFLIMPVVVVFALLPGLASLDLLVP
jgi:tight adherence protein C